MELVISPDSTLETQAAGCPLLPNTSRDPIPPAQSSAMTQFLQCGPSPSVHSSATAASSGCQGTGEPKEEPDVEKTRVQELGELPQKSKTCAQCRHADSAEPVHVLH